MKEQLFKADYWISAAFVLLSIFVILRIFVRKDYLRKGSLSAVTAALEWLLAMIWAGFSWRYLPGDWPLVHINNTLQFLGWTSIGAGSLILIISFASLGLRRAHGMGNEALKRSGPYRLSRNPQIVGFVLGIAGFSLVWPSWHMLVSMLLVVILSHVMVITEEEHLLRIHGNDYKEYCKQVPRYIGKLKKRPTPGSISER